MITTASRPAPHGPSYAIAMGRYASVTSPEARGWDSSSFFLKSVRRPIYGLVTHICQMRQLNNLFARLNIFRYSYSNGGKTPQKWERTMPKGPQVHKRPAEAIGNAGHIAQITSGEDLRTTLLHSAKRCIGLAGCKARFQNATSEDRKAIGQSAAAAGWV